MRTRLSCTRTTSGARNATGWPRAADRGLLEFTRTTEIVLRRLPAAPALVADIGGGPGRYALWLAGLGYQVEHRDLVPVHIGQLKEDADGLRGLHTAVGDARDLDLDDASVNAVLLLGPLYHLRDPANLSGSHGWGRRRRPGAGAGRRRPG
jgi:SAM-dependent methyltransferase